MAFNKEMADKILWPVTLGVIGFAVSFSQSIADRVRFVERQIAIVEGIQSTLQTHEQQLNHLSASNVALIVQNENLKVRMERAESWCRKRGFLP